MKEVLREVWGLLDLKGCEWLNKKALFCRGEFTPGTESEVLLDLYIFTHLRGHSKLLS